MENALESSLQRSPSAEALTRVELELDLPSDVSSAAFAIDDLGGVLSALDASEAAGDLPHGCAPKRRAEYLAGRHAAALALSALHLPSRVERSPTGLPVWPNGAVGSISHGGGLALAVCARQWQYRSVGVDVERVLHDAEARELAPAIAHQDELFLLRAALPHARSGQRLSVLFSAKESFFKCLYPLTGSFLEFSEARVVSVGMSSHQRGTLNIRLERDCGACLPSRRTWQARFALGARRIESAVLFDMG
jgi:enterobactin synthetase component D